MLDHLRIPSLPHAALYQCSSHDTDEVFDTHSSSDIVKDNSYAGRKYRCGNITRTRRADRSDQGIALNAFRLMLDHAPPSTCPTGLVLRLDGRLGTSWR